MSTGADTLVATRVDRWVPDEDGNWHSGRSSLLGVGFRARKRVTTSGEETAWGRKHEMSEVALVASGGAKEGVKERVTGGGREDVKTDVEVDVAKG